MNTQFSGIIFPTWATIIQCCQSKSKTWDVFHAGIYSQDGTKCEKLLWWYKEKNALLKHKKITTFYEIDLAGHALFHFFDGKMRALI